MLFSMIASAQYQPTAVEGRRWNQHLHQFTPLFPGMHYQEFRGDTLYKNRTMKKLISVDSQGDYESLEAIVFEDTTVPAITFYYPQTGLYGDSLYFNLNLNIGDSLMLQCNGDTGYYRADSISFFSDLTNITRKKHHFSFKMPQFSFGSRRTYFSWIEGLGDINGLVSYPIPPTCFSDPPAFEVICIFDSSSTQIYQNPNYSICDGVGIAETDYPEISLYPNPASTFVEIESINLTEVNTIQIINSAGMVVREILNPEKERLDVSKLSTGLYSLHIMLQENRSILKKFVISK